MKTFPNGKYPRVFTPASVNRADKEVVGEQGGAASGRASTNNGGITCKHTGRRALLRQ